MYTVVKVDPKIAINTLLKHGLAKARMGDKESAQACFQQVYELEPENETALFGLAYFASNPFDAKAYLKQLLAKNPENKTARIFYNKVYFRCLELEVILKNSALLNKWVNGNVNDNEALPRLGMYLLKYKYINEEQLVTALKFQKYLTNCSIKEKIGQVFVSLGLVSQEKLEEVLTDQKLEFNSRFV
jgi:tetratricopeptide (TPR) repeat protein